MDDRKKDQSIQSHANFDGDSATGDRTQIRQDQQNQQPPQIDPSLADAQAVAASLGVDPNTGLSQAEAERRLAQYGPNELASAPPVPKWKKFLAQFKDPLVYLLLAATGISLIAWFIEKANAAPGAEGGEALPFDAIVIVLILIVNAVLGYIQESKAEEAVEALSQMTAPQTNVLRDGKIARINTVDVVPGDVVMLGEGDSIPADGRLLAAASLRVAEASLTGESVPVGKNVDTLAEAKALGDRANMVFNGTSVTQGTGRAIVTSTGMRTQVGKIADLLQATDDDDSPLQKEMNYVSKILGIAVCIIAAVVLVALALTEGFNDIHDVIDSLLLSVSLAVAAVPEGLAAILTVVLALGVALLVPLQPVLQSPVLQPAFANVVPALFGAMAYQYFRKNVQVAVAPLVVMSLLFMLVPSLTSSTSFMIIPSGALAIGIAYSMYRKQKKEADVK